MNRYVIIALFLFAISCKDKGMPSDIRIQDIVDVEVIGGPTFSAGSKVPIQVTIPVNADTEYQKVTLIAAPGKFIEYSTEQRSDGDTITIDLNFKWTETITLDTYASSSGDFYIYASVGSSTTFTNKDFLKLN